MLVTTFTERVLFLDAHFTGFDDVGAMLASWQQVAHLDVLAPQLVANPGVARCHDLMDPALSGLRFAPLRDHLRRFAIHHTLCIALRTHEPAYLTVLILVRRTPGTRGTAEELRRLEQLGPLLAECYEACRSLALLRAPVADTTQLRMARVDRRGAFVQTTPAFSEAMWAGAGPQDVHLAPEVFRALRSGRPVPLPGGRLTLHAQADGDGWLLRLDASGAVDLLTAREREVAQRFARGQSYRTIADALALAPATVRNHLSNVYAKLRVRHRAALIDVLR
jgi:DNA-binding CsgD family transcriptional regulator